MVSDATGRPSGDLRMAAVASSLLLHQAEADVIKSLPEVLIGQLCCIYQLCIYQLSPRIDRGMKRMIQGYEYLRHWSISWLYFFEYCRCRCNRYLSTRMLSSRVTELVNARIYMNVV
jgi:hypothetical protein